MTTPANEPLSISPVEHVCDEDCAHTINVGYVHVLTEHGGPCVPDCPHPDHERDTADGN